MVDFNPEWTKKVRTLTAHVMKKVERPYTQNVSEEVTEAEKQAVSKLVRIYLEGHTNTEGRVSEKVPFSIEGKMFGERFGRQLHNRTMLARDALADVYEQAKLTQGEKTATQLAHEFIGRCEELIIGDARTR